MEEDKRTQLNGAIDVFLLIGFALGMIYIFTENKIFKSIGLIAVITGASIWIYQLFYFKSQQ